MTQLVCWEGRNINDRHHCSHYEPRCKAEDARHGHQRPDCWVRDPDSAVSTSSAALCTEPVLFFGSTQRELNYPAGRGWGGWRGNPTGPQAMLKAILVCLYLCIPHISADVLPWVLKETLKIIYKCLVTFLDKRSLPFIQNLERCLTSKR